MNHQSALLRELAAGSYGVYILHLLPVLTLQLALAQTLLPPLAKFMLVTLVAVLLSFLLACSLRQLAWVRRVM